MPDQIAILPFAVLIGVVLGALGSGGAILSLPILVYIAALPVRQAIGVSQFVVGCAALVGALLQARQGNIRWHPAIAFAIAGLPATRLGAWIAQRLDPTLLMLCFAAIAAVAGIRLLMSSQDASSGRIRLGVSLVSGAIVGFLTGLLGVGGGFLLVPALIAFGGLDARRATATSLPVIALNSLAGAVQQHGQWTAVISLALTFLGATLVGTFIGLRLGRKASDLKLKQALGALLIGVGCVVAVANLWKR